jgi:D-alanyl-D-alanine carboxypeptidase
MDISTTKANDKGYLTRIARLNLDLGIYREHVAKRGIPIYREGADLVKCCTDDTGRIVWIASGAMPLWTDLRRVAGSEGITIRLISAFRSLEAQAKIIEKKLRAAQPLDTILRVNAPPGFSQHHTGMALDFADASESEVLTEAFATTRAYAWLCHHGSEFRISQPYPRGNAFGFDWEPWHWAFDGIDALELDPSLMPELRALWSSLETSAEL